MTYINFKNVGQGDTIIIEGVSNGNPIVGIIDCNLYESRNLCVEYLVANNIREIEFLILSHFHEDHFSGMPELFKYCHDNNIIIKKFLHTLSAQIFQIYDKIFVSMRTKNLINQFFDNLDLYDKGIKEDISVSVNTATIKILGGLKLSFFAPKSKVAIDIAKQIKRKVNTKSFQKSDLNKFATIAYLENDSSGVLFTSDAGKKSFIGLQTRINKTIELIQAPHHGSFSSIKGDFWKELNRNTNCPVCVSVGSENKYKLPSREAIEFYESNDYVVHSTNYTHGIKDYFNNTNSITKSTNEYTISQYLNTFSRKRTSVSHRPGIQKRFEGDQRFNVFI